jgi:hypothetical protein
MKIDFDERDPSQSQYIGSTLDEIAMLSWMAGIWEGEGTVMIDRSYSLLVLVTNCDRLILEPFQRFGGKVRSTGKRKNPNHRECFVWRIVGSDAAYFLRRIVPYCRSEKKARVWLGIRYQEVRALPSDLIHGAGRGRGSQLPPGWEEERQQFFDQMKALNKKGPRD